MSQSPNHIFNPTMKALQFRAWAHCQTHGTNMTIEDLASALDAPPARLRRALRDERWSKHLRTATMDLAPVRTQFDQTQIEPRDYIRA